MDRFTAADVKDILFVCTANICRSPFAEEVLRMHLLERRVEGIKVHSAGVIAVPGLRPPAEAIEVASELGVDMSHHTSRPLSVEMIEQADLILVMNLFHKARILALDPESGGKLRLLGSYSTFHGNLEEEMEIPDPYRLSPFHYRSSFNIIRDCVQNFMKDFLVRE
ncbi:MAG: low molecular weight protein arginine phosphatase [Pseudomonadota bacterium]